MIGTYVNNYEIDEIIEHGGMSTVYLGIHKDIGYSVAVKSLNPALINKPGFKDRFKNEALLLSKLKHPNILSFYDYVENENGVFIITEYVKGQTLDNYIEQISGPIPETATTKIMLKMLDAVEYIHYKNIIHRDIKPANFMITPDHDIRIIDFGIAKSLEDVNPSFTKDGSKVGTTFYMSPQQVKGQILDRRSDIYSLGVTLFQMVTGQYPYDKNATEYEIYNKIINEPLPSAQSYYVGVSQKIQDIITKATQKKPLDRFQSCDQFRKALLAGNEKKESIDAEIPLKTKLLEATDVDIDVKIFSKKFWQNLILIFASVSFIAAIGTGLYYLTHKDVRHVIEDKQLLLSGDSLNADPVEVLNYGETVKVLSFAARPDKNGITWIKVYSLRGNAGFVPKTSLEIPQIYRQINIIFGNTAAGTAVPSRYKQSLRKYYIDNGLMKGNFTSWKIFSEQKKDFEFNTISFGDFNDNTENDFACVCKNIETNNYTLLIFFDNLNETISIDFKHSPIKIKTVEKGKGGGKWYLGTDSIPESANNSAKFDYLQTVGLLVLNTETNENKLYLYNSEEKLLESFLQPKIK